MSLHTVQTLLSLSFTHPFLLRLSAFFLLDSFASTSPAYLPISLPILLPFSLPHLTFPYLLSPSSPFVFFLSFPTLTSTSSPYLPSTFLLPLLLSSFIHFPNLSPLPLSSPSFSQLHFPSLSPLPLSSSQLHFPTFYLPPFLHFVLPAPLPHLLSPPPFLSFLLRPPLPLPLSSPASSFPSEAMSRHHLPRP